MPPDVWISLGAIAAALAAIPVARWLARTARRLEEERAAHLPQPPAPATAAARPAAPVASPVLMEVRGDQPPPIVKRRRRRRLTRRAARDGVVLASILGPCRGVGAQELDVR
jgi:hypothetical protein